MVVLHRSPNRDCRHQRDRLGRALAEATECAMHRRNQSRKLINGDTILRDITTDDLRNQARIDLLRTAIIGHIFCPSKALLANRLINGSRCAEYMVEITRSAGPCMAAPTRPPPRDHASERQATEALLP